MKNKSILFTTSIVITMLLSGCVYDRVVMNKPITKEEKKSEETTDFSTPVKIQPLTEFKLSEIEDLTETKLSIGPSVPTSSKSSSAENYFPAITIQSSIAAELKPELIAPEFNYNESEFQNYARYNEISTLEVSYADYYWLPWLGLIVCSAAVALGVYFSRKMDRFNKEIEKEYLTSRS